MSNFDVRKSSRKCHVDEQPFAPGEIFYSALMELDNGETERQDFCQTHWKEPTKDCIGWWKSQVPESGKGKVYWAPRSVLISFFEHSLSQPSTLDIAYVTGLMLLQKKILVMDEELDGGAKIRLRNRLNKSTFDVPVFELTPDRLEEVQQILAEKLFMDEPVDTLEEEPANEG